jgi:hypothetical protein
MYSYFLENKNKIEQKQLVHGNLDASTIITNNYYFKFINFENAFVGSPFFDLSNIVFELQMTGMKEYDFITKRIEDYKLCDNRLESGSLLKEYKLCKYIWTRKKFLDMVIEYVKEVLVLNSTREFKLIKLAHNFSNHFYRFSDIKIFNEIKDGLVQEFKKFILDR